MAVGWATALRVVAYALLGHYQELLDDVDFYFSFISRERRTENSHTALLYFYYSLGLTDILLQPNNGMRTLCTVAPNTSTHTVRLMSFTLIEPKLGCAARA